MKKLSILAVLLLSICFGCSTYVKRDSVTPFSSDDAQAYSSIKKIAILPFDNLSKTKDAEKLINALILTELLNKDIFDSIEDVRYVASVMKMLKIKRTEILDRDLVLKMGETMRCEAVVVGQIDAYEIGKKDESTDISISAAMFDTRSGDILWTANVTHSSSTSLGKVFGVTPGPNHLDMARTVVEGLSNSLASRIKGAREIEADMEVDKKYLEEPDSSAPAGEIKSTDDEIEIPSPAEPEIEEPEPEPASEIEE